MGRKAKTIVELKEFPETINCTNIKDYTVNDTLSFLKDDQDNIELTTIATIPPKTDTKEFHKVINGDNLLALKTLLKDYRGKVDFIFIDPPYNCNNSHLIYEDSGNTKGLSRLDKTKKWYNDFRRRMEVAEQLLTRDGMVACCMSKDSLPETILLLKEVLGGGTT